MEKEYLASVEDVLDAQSSNAEAGLSAAEAAARLASVGPNKLEEEEKTPMWKRFFEQMADPMVIMLLVAAAISVITGFIQGEPEWADAAIILSVVILNSVLGVVQEAKSEQALEALQEMSAAQSKVIRDGKLVQLPSSELVPGDVVLLEAGDSVPADCRVIESASMKIEEAALKMCIRDSPQGVRQEVQGCSRDQGRYLRRSGGFRRGGQRYRRAAHQGSCLLYTSS